MDTDFEAPHTSDGLTSDDIARWNSHIRAIPLMRSQVPTGGCPLENLDDESLLNVPPHLIAHVQRTAAQGGLQVISPRQTPFSALMVRTNEERRQLGDHIVGSTANKWSTWPTVDDYDMSELLPDQPLCPRAAGESIRKKTITEPLTSNNRILSDPILACLVKGRAAIDLLRRDDVNGGAEELTELLASAWGIEKAEMDDMDSFTLGITGSLLRHCIKADEVYPVIHAPIQVKRSIGVGVSQVSRDVLPADSGMDWRRMRVFCEAVFFLSISVEGHRLTDITATPPPGDPTAAGNRPGTLCFRPAPATSWYHGSETFSIMPTSVTSLNPGRGVPRDVYSALARYVDVARPLLKIERLGQAVKAKRTTAMSVEPADGETIRSAYVMMSKCLIVGTARGRTSSATIRNLIYNALEQGPLPIRMRLARYIAVATKECVTHLGSSDVPDTVIDKLASKFKALGDHIRMKVAEEATKRGHTIDAWWADVMAQVPKRYEEFNEGTAGWTKVALWLTFKANSSKWAALAKAVEFSALRTAQQNAVASMAVSPTLGSSARILEVAVATVRGVSEVYAAYYNGIVDVAMAMSDEQELRKRPRSAAILREASYLWSMRARALQGTLVEKIGKDIETRSKYHTRFDFGEVDLVLVPAPYRAFDAYKAHVEVSKWLPSTYKKHVAKFTEYQVSKCFRKYEGILLACPESIVTRYLLNPKRLAADMEKGWVELAEDIRTAVKRHAMPRPTQKVAKPAPIVGEQISVALPVARASTRDYYQIIGDLEPDEVDWMEDRLERIDPLLAEEVMAREFRDADELRRILLEADDPRREQTAGGRETVN